MSERVCDNKSVGIIIKNSEDKLLLIERKKYPFGFAPPAGHVDDHGSYEQAVINETREEVGLNVENLNLLSEGRMENPCRREGGSWHFWKVYEVKTSGTIKRSQEETKQIGWFAGTQIDKLAERTRQYINNKISEDEWIKNPGLEVVWLDWFIKLKLVSKR